MSKRRRRDIGRRCQSNVQRATLRANNTDNQRETDQENSRIAMSELRSLRFLRVWYKLVKRSQAVNYKY